LYAFRLQFFADRINPHDTIASVSRVPFKVVVARLEGPNVANGRPLDSQVCTQITRNEKKVCDALEAIADSTAKSCAIKYDGSSCVVVFVHFATMQNLFKASVVCPH
jgi:hypothetical protein